MSPRFLFDENIDPVLAQRLRTVYAGIDILLVGQIGAPAKGASDPDLLAFAQKTGRILVSFDKASLPRHLGDWFRAGGQTAGVALMRQGYPWARYVQEIALIWQASEAGEWLNLTQYLP